MDEAPLCIVCGRPMQPVPVGALPKHIVLLMMHMRVPLETVKQFECSGHCECCAFPANGRQPVRPVPVEAEVH